MIHPERDTAVGRTEPTRRGQRLLLGLMVVLAGALAWQAWQPIQAPAPAMPHGAGPVRTRFAVEPPADRGRAASAVLARPLFSIGRKPARRPAASAQAATDTLPRLSGIVIAAAQRRAIFASGGKAEVRGEGEQIGPYTVVAINQRLVTLAGPAGRRSIGLSFDGNRVVPAPGGLSILDQFNTQPPRVVPPPGPGELQNLFARQIQARGAKP